MKKILSLCLSALLLCSLCSCSVSFVSGTFYPDAEKYSVGDAAVSGKVTALDIDWSAGRLILQTGPDDTVTLAETARIELTDEYRVHYWLDGEVLRVRYAASGRRTFPPDMDKTLTVTVPASLTLDKLAIGTGSAAVEITDLSAAEVIIGTGSGRTRASLHGTQNVRLDTASGGAELTLDGASACSLSTASGSVSLTASEEIGQLRADTASGALTLTFPSAQNVEVGTASGKVTVSSSGAIGSAEIDSASGDVRVECGGAIGKLELETSSGDVRVDCAGTVGSMDLETASGKVVLTLPADAGFTLDFDTASGDFDCDFPVKIDGDRYVTGNGSTPIRVDTASGDVEIRSAGGR